MSTTPSPFSLLTSLRWDPILKAHPDCAYGAPVYLLSHHRERLLNAARWFNANGTLSQGRGTWGGVISWLEDIDAFERAIVEGIRGCAGVDVDVDGPLRVIHIDSIFLFFLYIFYIFLTTLATST